MSSSAIANSRPRRIFCGHESERVRQLDGVPLASSAQRAIGYVVDLLIAVALWAPLEIGWRILVLHKQNIHVSWDFHEIGNVIVLILYLGLPNYPGNGQTPGKWLARTRAVSLKSERMGFWQSIERALGYGAAVLECGLGLLAVLLERQRARRIAWPKPSLSI